MPKMTSTKTNDNQMTTSFRVDRSVWDDARARAKREGVSLTDLMMTLVEGYVRGAYVLPRREFPRPQDRFDGQPY